MVHNAGRFDSCNGPMSWLPIFAAVALGLLLLWRRRRRISVTVEQESAIVVVPGQRRGGFTPDRKGRR